jgi:DNA-binding NtrC family response regulator
MPKVDGLQAANEISKLLPGVQIVLHTMYGARVVLEAHKHGIFRVVEKAKSGALVSAVQELLNTNAEQPNSREFTARSGSDATNQNQG